MNSKKYKEYAIDDFEYLELKYFCLRHGYNGFKKGVSSQRDKEIGMIETALTLSADEPVRGFIRKSISCKHMPYERLGSVPMGRKQFYEARRKFFYILKKLKIG